MIEKFEINEVCMQENTEQCNIKLAIDILSKKWTMVIIRDLIGNKHRYGELEKSLSGISPKTLSTRLKELEEMRIISRCEEARVTYYQLTEIGMQLEKIIRDLDSFGGYYRQTTNNYLLEVCDE